MPVKLYKQQLCDKLFLLQPKQPHFLLVLMFGFLIKVNKIKYFIGQSKCTSKRPLAEIRYHRLSLVVVFLV